MRRSPCVALCMPGPTSPRPLTLLRGRHCVPPRPVVHSDQEYQPCVSVAYYTAASTEENFRLQCYCGTTAQWSANLSPAVISARFDGAKECWCAPARSAHRDTHLDLTRTDPPRLAPHSVPCSRTQVAP